MYYSLKRLVTEVAVEVEITVMYYSLKSLLLTVEVEITVDVLLTKELVATH